MTAYSDIDLQALKQGSEELRKTVDRLDDTFFAAVARAAQLLKTAFENSHKVLVCGNGGSAAEAQHFSDEMLGRYRTNRKSHPVIALTADSAALTCIGNDFGFEQIFSRQVEALGNEGDVLLAISTSGNSRNVLSAVEVARQRNMKVVALTAPQGALRQRAEVSIESPATDTARIQEIHLLAIHLLSEVFEP